MFLSQTGISSLTMAGDNFSVDLAASDYRAGTCNARVKIMVGKQHAI